MVYNEIKEMKLMKKFLSILITVLMLMQMFTFAVSSEEASMYAYWTGEGPGEIEFTTISGVKEYSIRLYRNENLVVDTSHNIGDYDITSVKLCFLDEITQNGSGTYRATFTLLITGNDGTVDTVTDVIESSY